MRRTCAIAVLFITAIMTVLSGCEKSADSKEPSSQLSGEITFLATGGNKDYVDLWNRVIQQFETQHPDAAIHLVFQNGVYLKQLRDLSDQGKLPDVFMGSPSLFKEFNEKGSLKDLRLLAKLNADDLNGYFEEALLSFSSENGKLISIPTFLATPQLLYSKPYFQKAGLPEPKANITWQDFAELSKRIQEKSNGTNPYGVLFPLQLQLLSSLVLSNGGATSPDGKLYQGHLDNEKSVEAISWYARLAKDGAIKTETVEESMHLLANGTSAMYVTFASPPLQDRANIGVRPFPTFAGGTRAMNSLSGGIAVSEKTKHPDLAWAFLKFIAIEKNEMTVALANQQGEWGTSNPMTEPFRNDAYFQVKNETYPYVKKDIFDWNVNVWNVSFAKINYQLRQTIGASDIKTELVTLSQLLESTLQ